MVKLPRISCTNLFNSSRLTNSKITYVITYREALNIITQRHNSKQCRSHTYIWRSENNVDYYISWRLRLQSMCPARQDLRSWNADHDSETNSSSATHSASDGGRYACSLVIGQDPERRNPPKNNGDGNNRKINKL